MAFNQQQREEIVSQIVANGPFGEEDNDALLELTDNQLVALAKPSELDEMVTNSLTTNETDDDEDDDEEEGKGKNMPSKKGKDKEKPTANEQVTLEDWMNSAPPEIQRMVANSQQIEKRERDQLIGQITANDNCPFTAEELGERSTEDLQAFARIATTGRTAPQTPTVNFPNFEGAAGVSPTTNRQESKVQPMGLPGDMFAESNK